MIRHAVMFKWAQGLGSAHTEADAAALARLVEQIPEIAAYHYGPDAGINAGNFDYAIIGDFATVDDYLAYRDHPEHQTFIRELIAGNVTDRAAVQFGFDG